MTKKCFFAFLLCALTAWIGVFSRISAQTTDGMFSDHLKVDRKILDDNPLLAKAYDEWNAKIERPPKVYVVKLEKMFEREKSKGDLEFLKSFEKTLNEAKTYHTGPCILFDRLSPKIAGLQTEMNKAKSKTNRAFIEVIDREIAAALKQKDLEKAKAIEAFFVAAFLPPNMGFKFEEATRNENLIYLHNASKMTWTDACAWARQRNGDLASISNAETNDLLLRIMRKQSGGAIQQSWSGGIRIDGQWYWTDGTPFRYTNWIKGQPSGVNHKGVRQDYISFAVHKEAGWDDNSNFPLPFMIQWTLY